MPSDSITASELLTGHLVLDAVTMGVSLRDCSSRLLSTARARAYDKIRRACGTLRACIDDTVERYGASCTAIYVSTSPIGVIFDGLSTPEYVALSETLERAALDIGVDGMGAMSALCSKALSRGDRELISAIPSVLVSTRYVSASVACAESGRGINTEAVDLVAAAAVADPSVPPALTVPRLAILANASGRSPYLPAAYHGLDEREVALRVSVSSSEWFADWLAREDADQLRSRLSEGVGDLRASLFRGAQFLGLRCAELLRRRSGLDVQLDRVCVSPPRLPQTGANGQSRPAPATIQHAALELAGHPGFLSGVDDAKSISQALVRVTGDAGPETVGTALMRQLTNAIAGGFEHEVLLAAGVTP